MPRRADGWQRQPDALLCPAQASDLRRLLEMYWRWQLRFFPQHGFDEAIGSIAELGRSHRIKVRAPRRPRADIPALGLLTSRSARRCRAVAQGAAAARACRAAGPANACHA